MTITIPTSEFVGLITDVAPFAFPKPDLPDVNVVRLEWTGEMLHASTTDTMRCARSSWHPDDDPTTSGKHKQDALFGVYGGADDRWVVIAGLDDAREIAKIYKLPDKEGLTPLQLDYSRNRLRVIRSADTGHQAITTVVQPRMAEFPDLRKILDVDLLESEAVGQIAYTGRHLADLGTVRQRGTLRLNFAGDRRATRVTIGDRFVATLRPEYSSPLASASGLLVTVGVGEG
jgi:hypothetical protein